MIKAERGPVVWVAMMLVVICTGASGSMPASRAVSVADVAPQSEVLFPIGSMGVQREESFAQVAASRFNVVHEFRGIQEIDEAEDYLERAAAAGLSVIQNMPACRAYAVPACQAQGITVWGEGQWATFISTLAAYPNLIAWFLPDEIRDYAAAANLYAWVHKYDPLDRPVFGNPGSLQPPILELFTTFGDAIWSACYPEYEGLPRALVTYAMNLDADVCEGTDVRYGAILQLFDRADFLGGSSDYPTPRELRNDSYQAIIAGATGLWYFSYELGKDLDGLFAEVSKIADEIAGAGGLDEVIASPEMPQTIGHTVVSGPTQSPVVEGRIYDSIQTLQKMHGDTYLFAVNIAVDTVVVRFESVPTRLERVEVLFEGREIPVSGSTFEDTFAELDVHVYRMVSHRSFLPLVVDASP